MIAPRLPLLLSAGLVALGVFALRAAPSAALPAKVDFNRDVRPILADNCYQCHGPDKNQRKRGLRLDTKEGIFGKPGAVVPGSSRQSAVYQRLVSDDKKERMPQAKSNKTLTPRQIEIVKNWIDQGAEYRGHWAYVTPARVEPPAVDPRGFVRNAVDDFILARLEELGLPHAPEADRVTLLRRLSFDLTGLPPTKAAVDAFVADSSPDAYEKVVDRLLASPHFGERLAMHWLDLVRFADTCGYHSDNPINVAPYRDWVVDAFNANKPFDQFTIEQLAGDLLPQATRAQKVASAYNRLLQTTEEGGAQAKEYEAKYAADRVRNVSTVWLGSTMGCCQCHDHKFDPFTTREFYALAAFFADVQEAAVGRREPGMPLPTPEQTAALDGVNAEIARLKPAIKWLPGLRAAVVPLERRRDELNKSIPTCLVTLAGAPRTVRVLARGNWLDDSGEVVQPGVPCFLPAVAPSAAGRLTRLDLARWIVRPDNPLTARVFVNRLWKLYFGQGLSKILDDLGAQGEWPTHPELLDWLAVEFAARKWDVKAMVRLLVTSGAYRQSSQRTAEQKERDPYNRYLSHQTRWRLDAEVVRDSALAVSGLLNRQVGGPSVFPYQPPGYWAALNFPTREWQNDKGPRLYRRGMYTHWQRSFPQPSLLAFDAPSREECCVERPRSNIPQQALVLLNDPTYVEAARALAERIVKEAGPDSTARVAWAFGEVLARAPTPEETKVLVELHARHAAQYAVDKEAAAKLLHTGDRALPERINPTDLAAWTSVARVLLNLHETITRP